MRFFIKSLLTAFLFFTFCSTALFAQVDQLIQVGKEMYNFGDKREALNVFKQALNKDPDNVEANFMAGKCYIETIHKHKSVPYFLKAYEEDENVRPNILFLIAWGYQLGEKFDKAINYYKKHKNNLTDDKLDKMDVSEDDEIEEIKRRIYECKNGKEFVKNPYDYDIKNAGDAINTKYPDYAPVISSDASLMIFTSRRESGIGKNKANDNMYYEDIFMTKWNSEKWTKATNLGENVNTKNHDASNGLSPDGEKLFTYKFERGNGGDIYVCKKNKNGKWSKPENMGRKINSRHKEASISISQDGNTAYFSSDRPGGEGGLDIYKSEKDNRGNWNTPENLGETINTKYDEDSPFISVDGNTLYFSSRGHKGMGGYDIFKSTYNEEKDKWSEPENMGVPINSPDNDIYFVVKGNGHLAYYSSIKDSTLGDKDIYRIDLKPEKISAREAKVKDKDTTVEDKVKMKMAKDTSDQMAKNDTVKPSQKKDDSQATAKDTTDDKVEMSMAKDTGKVVSDQQKSKNKENNKTSEISAESSTNKGAVLKGKLLDAGNNEPLKGSVKITDSKGNVLKTIDVGKNGKYKTVLNPDKSMKVKLSAFSDGHIYREKRYRLLPDQKQVLDFNFELIKMKTGQRVILRNVYFEFDKAKITEDSRYQINNLYELLKKNKNLKVEIGGHTDNIGSSEYNRKLSKARANSVKEYLVNKGISSERITTQGYGESQPLASNDDEKAGRELNRRTEFKILNK